MLREVSCFLLQKFLGLMGVVVARLALLVASFLTALVDLIGTAEFRAPKEPAKAAKSRDSSDRSGYLSDSWPPTDGSVRYRLHRGIQSRSASVSPADTK